MCCPSGSLPSSPLPLADWTASDWMGLPWGPSRGPKRGYSSEYAIPLRHLLQPTHLFDELGGVIARLEGDAKRSVLGANSHDLPCLSVLHRSQRAKRQALPLTIAVNVARSSSTRPPLVLSLDFGVGCRRHLAHGPHTGSGARDKFPVFLAKPPPDACCGRRRRRDLRWRKATLSTLQ